MGLEREGDNAWLGLGGGEGPPKSYEVSLVTVDACIGVWVVVGISMGAGVTADNALLIDDTSDIVPGLDDRMGVNVRNGVVGVWSDGRRQSLRDEGLPQNLGHSVRRRVTRLQGRLTVTCTHPIPEFVFYNIPRRTHELLERLTSRRILSRTNTRGLSVSEACGTRVKSHTGIVGSRLRLWDLVRQQS